MGLINFNDIDCKKSIDSNNTIVNFNNCDIQIIKYLSAQDKYDFIMITIQKAYENGLYNKYKLDVYFDLHLVYMYTNIIFNKDELLDEMALYDICKRSGLIDVIKSAIPAEELNELKNFVNTIAAQRQDYDNTFVAILKDLVKNLSGRFGQILEVMQTQNPELMQQINTILSNTVSTSKETEAE